MMKLKADSLNNRLSYQTDALLKKLLSPLCGLVREAGLLRRSSRSPRVVSIGGDLTGIHVLLKKAHPGQGAYHIGATGLDVNDALIKTLGESVERYAQLISEISGRLDIVFLSLDEIIACNKGDVLSRNQLNPFNFSQYANKNFPLTLYQNQPLGWIRLPSLLSDKTMWVPAQFILVGYQVKQRQGEPWIAPAVTTGTATHSDPIKALMNATLELIQIDSAMGHWYSSRIAKRIGWDNRVRGVERMLSRHHYFSHKKYAFYYLENPDLLGFSIACVYTNANTVPRVAIGLGSDTSLSRAIYKAYLEALGVVGLARMVKSSLDADACYDLDSNVGYYASGQDFSFIQHKFSSDIFLASDLPCDLEGDDATQLTALVRSFKESNKELLFCDLTCKEAVDVGLVVPRVWSPDTLSLCLPSAPYMNHARYLSYGGISHSRPHPYP